MKLKKRLFKELEDLYPQMVDIRRDMHMYPEVSFHEKRTPELIIQHLEKLGIEYKSKVGGNGIVGILRGGHPGPTVALRADFDGLPIHDEKDISYRSKIDGVSHACGHDIHTATLMGVETVLSKYREYLSGNIVFIHQFGEELPPGGSRLMIEDGCLEDVDYIYGAHVWADDEYGQVSISEGHVMAGGDNFEIIIQGKGGHGAMPHLTVDPLVTASQLVMNLQQVVSRRLNPNTAGVLTIGEFHSGNTMSVIPDTARITGTTRAFNIDIKREMEDWIRLMTKTTVEQAGATATVNFTYGYDALWNHPEETYNLKKLVGSELPELDMIDKEPMMTAEDFTYYLKERPGTFFFVGGRNDEINAVYPHHHPLFDVDEKSMLNIGKIFLLIILDHLFEPDGDENE